MEGLRRGSFVVKTYCIRIEEIQRRSTGDSDVIRHQRMMAHASKVAREHWRASGLFPATTDVDDHQIQLRFDLDLCVYLYFRA